jgi:hypothetical protein
MKARNGSNGYPIEQIDQSHAGLERSELHPVSDEHEGGREVLWRGEFPLLKSSREAEQTNFNDCQLLRINEMPVIEVHMMPSERVPTGAAEFAVPPVAPALCNAIFAAMGRRVRRLPIWPEALA